jgi:hypothetical protein
VTLLLLRISRRFQHFRFKDTHRQKEKRKKTGVELKRGGILLYHPPDKSPGQESRVHVDADFPNPTLLSLFYTDNRRMGGSLRGPIRTTCTRSRIRRISLYVCNSWSLYCYRIIERDFPARYIYSIHLHNGGKKRKTKKNIRKQGAV